MGSCLSKREPTFSIGRICRRHPWPSSAASLAVQGRSPSPSQKPPQKTPQTPPPKPSPKLSPKPSQKPSQESSQTPSQYLAWAEEALQKRRVAERGRAWTGDEETGKWSKCATHASKEETEGLEASSQKPWQKPRVWTKDEETGKWSKCSAHASREEMEGLKAPSQKPSPPSLCPSPWAAAFRAVQERSPSPSSESEGFLATTRTLHVTSTSAQGPGDQDGLRPAASCAVQGCSPLPTSQPEGFLDEDFAYDSDECEALEIKLMQDTATESSGHFPAISNQVARRRALTLMEKETDEDRRVQDQFRTAAHIRNGADDKYLRKNTELEMNGADEAIPVLSSSPEGVVSAPVAVE